MTRVALAITTTMLEVGLRYKTAPILLETWKLSLVERKSSGENETALLSFSSQTLSFLCSMELEWLFQVHLRILFLIVTDSDLTRMVGMSILSRMTRNSLHEGIV